MLLKLRAFGANITGCIFKNNGKGIAITIKNFLNIVQ